MGEFFKGKLKEDFKIKVAADVNSIGFDFGDGDIIVAIAMEKDMRRLPLQDGAGWDRCPNVIAGSPNVKDGDVTWLHQIGGLADIRDIYYCNFKRSPRSDAFKDNFSEDDGKGKKKKYVYTHGELMELAFAEQVETVLVRTAEWNINKPTVMFVGCPAGTVDPNSEWYGTQEAYAEFLMNALETYADRNPKSRLAAYRKKGCLKSERIPIEIKVLSESNAAVAFELNRRSETLGKRKGMGKNILLIDLGSSTTDFSYVSDERQILELNYSRTLGGGNFEENMLKLLTIQETGGLGFKYPTNVKVWLRSIKEWLYNSIKMFGMAVTLPPYKLTLVDGSRATIQIDEEFLKRAIEEIPVTVPGSLRRDVPTLKCSSLREAYKSVFAEYYGKIREYVQMHSNSGVSVKPDLIIVTGGVSRVDWVKELVAEVFKAEVTDSMDCHGSVALGLAYAAHTEVKMQIVVENIMQRVRNMLGEVEDKVFQNLASSMAQSYADDEFRLLEKAIKDWADDPKPASIDDWFDPYEKNYIEKMPLSIELKKWWDTGLYAQDVREEQLKSYSENINQWLLDKFNEFFKETNGEFVFTINETEIFKKLDGKSASKLRYRDPRYYFFEDTDESFREDIKLEQVGPRHSKRAYYQRFLERKDKLKHNIKEDYEKALKEGKIPYFDRKTGEEGIKDYNLTGEPAGKPVLNSTVELLYEAIQEQIEKYGEFLTRYFYMTDKQPERSVVCDECDEYTPSGKDLPGEQSEMEGFDSIYSGSYFERMAKQSREEANG